MREICIVPTFQRPDMLSLCLEAIRRAEPTIPLHIFPDRGTDEREIATKYGAIHHLTIQHSYHGNSFNMLEALKWAYGQRADRVFVIEDDAVIDPSFFSWCRDSLDNPRMGEDFFAACGWQYSPNAIIGEGPNVSMNWYLSVCACIPRKSLNWIVPHAKPEYYGNMKQYLNAAYPQSHRRGSNHYEQDGLILRVLEAQQKRCVWPRRPRATHVGCYGYHMPNEPLQGTLDERVDILRLAVGNPVMLRKLMDGQQPEIGKCKDCQRPLLTERKKGRMVCVKCFHSAHPDLPVTSTSVYYLNGARTTSDNSGVSVVSREGSEPHLTPSP